MTTHHRSSMPIYLAPAFFFGRLTEMQQCWQARRAFPQGCSGVLRMETTGKKWSRRILESEIGSLFLQPAVLESVWDRRSIKGLRNVETRAEAQESEAKEKFDYKYYDALMRGGDEVSEMMKETAYLLEDITGYEKDDEEIALRMAVAGVVGQKLEKLDHSFLLALDWMIERTEKEKDDKKKRVLDLIKETILGQLSLHSPSQVQVVSALCATKCKDARQEILRRCAGGGGIFQTQKGTEIKLPGANLNDVANQADDIIGSMEENPLVPDRRLLAKLIIVREEARSLLSGGILDERNDNKGFQNLAGAEVMFLSKLVALRPGPQARERLANVLRGKDEGEEKLTDERNTEERSSKPRNRRRLINIGNDEDSRNEESFCPVRPGMFMETVTKLLAGMYGSHTVGGVTVQQLEWIYRVALDILQDIAYS